MLDHNNFVNFSMKLYDILLTRSKSYPRRSVHFLDYKWTHLRAILGISTNIYGYNEEITTTDLREWRPDTHPMIYVCVCVCLFSEHTFLWERGSSF